MKYLTITYEVKVQHIEEKDATALGELISDHILQDFDEAEVDLKETARTQE